MPFRDSVSAEFGNAWWLKSSPHTYVDAMNRSGIAVYAAANWDEGFTGHGPSFTFNNLRTPKKLILGPGKHCDWTTVLKETGFDIVTEELRFFDYWLHGIDNGVMREPAVTYYTYNEAPDRAWKSSKVWPLRAEQRTAFYLRDGALATDKPTSPDGATRKQVSYDTEAEAFWTSGMTFLTEPLAQDTEVTGHPSARLWIVVVLHRRGHHRAHRRCGAGRHAHLRWHRGKTARLAACHGKAAVRQPGIALASVHAGFGTAAHAGRSRRGAVRIPAGARTSSRQVTASGSRCNSRIPARRRKSIPRPRSPCYIAPMRLR